MPKYTYIPMPGGVLNKNQAVIAGRELNRISKKEGAITPEKVVDASRPEGAPLHDFFTWNDESAAELYRQEEARRIIRSVRIVRVDMPPQEQPTVRAFLNVTASETETKFEGQAYLPVAVIRKSSEYEQQVISRAKEELRQWTARYEDYRQFFGDIIHEVVGDLE